MTYLANIKACFVEFTDTEVTERIIDWWQNIQGQIRIELIQNVILCGPVDATILHCVWMLLVGMRPRDC